MNKILLGDCLERLKELPDNSVDSVVTDPPYELGFMGKSWDNTGIANNASMWKECLRVLKPGGYLLAFSGTRTYHRMAVAIEDAGFEVRDMIEWVYGSGFPKSLDVAKAIEGKLVLGNSNVRNIKKLDGIKTEVNDGMNESGLKQGYRDKVYVKIKTDVNFTNDEAKQYRGWGTALKPSHESIMVATKPLNTIPLNTCDDCNIIWELNSFVKIVEELSKLNLQELTEDMLNSVLLNVEVKNNILGNSKEVMDILQSNNQIINSTLNTVLSWKRIWEEVLNQMNISTISMEKEMITDLKTLKLLIGQLTLLNIMQVQNNQANGETVNVCIVENLLKGVLWKLRDIQTLSVRESAILKENNLNFAPSHEPICMARKPLSEKTVAENCLKWGTGGINIDESRVETEEKWEGKLLDNPKPLTGYEGGNGLNNQTSSSHQLGRFPANLIHDNSEEVRGCFPETKSGVMRGKQGGFGNSDLVFGDNSEIPEAISYGDNGNASRFFKSILYYPKASKSERNKGCEGLEKGCDHPTVKPVALMEYLIKMVTPKGGIVLDPFAGSGTTGVACVKNNYQYILIEMEEEYVKIIEARLKPYLKQEKIGDLNT